MDYNNAALFRTKLIANLIRANRNNHGRQRGPRDSSTGNHGLETRLTSGGLERRRKAKERYAALIRPSRTGPQPRITRNQGLRQQRRHRSFFEDIGNNITQDNSSVPISFTPNTITMEKKPYEHNESTEIPSNDIHGLRSSYSIACETQQQKLIKDVSTTCTLRTSSTSTSHSDSPSSTLEAPQAFYGKATVVSPSSSNTSHPDRTFVETEVSNLTESPSSEEPKRVEKASRFQKGSGTPRDSMLSSVSRLQEIERKRSLVRDQRFGLEKRLQNFRRVATAPNGGSEEDEDDGEGTKTVVNWEYNIRGRHSNTKSGGRTAEKKGLSVQDLVQRKIIYTGRLNASGIPHDDNALLRFADEQIYKGRVRNGERHGWGTNQWPDGQTYSGEWRNDSRSGRGTHIWRDGRTVTGTWKDGHLHGEIYFRWPNGAIYDGNASMGKRDGKGLAKYPDGTLYNGNYLKGKENGFGTLTRSDGVKYRGEFRNGLKEGYGVMLWHTRTYDGEWMNDKPHGQGRVVWSNGAIYNGKFQEGVYSGMGVYIWPSGKKFVGNWEKGVKNGHGVHTWPSGQVYDGQYSDGVKEGYGRMTWPDGSRYCGGFKRNRRSGRGIQIDANGTLVHCGLWWHDRPYEKPEDHGVVYIEKLSSVPEVKHQYPVSTSGFVTVENGNKEEGRASYPRVATDALELPTLQSLSPAVVTPTGDADSSTSSAEVLELSDEETVDEFRYRLDVNASNVSL